MNHYATGIHSSEWDFPRESQSAEWNAHQGASEYIDPLRNSRALSRNKRVEHIFYAMCGRNRSRSGVFDALASGSCALILGSAATAFLELHAIIM